MTLLYFFSIFVGNFCPHGSETGSATQINSDPCGFGSETLTTVRRGGSGFLEFCVTIQIGNLHNCHTPPVNNIGKELAKYTNHCRKFLKSSKIFIIFYRYRYVFFDLLLACMRTRFMRSRLVRPFPSTNGWM